MPEATRTVVIDRPVDDVFAFFTDHGNDPTWRPLVIEIAPPHPVGVGSVIRQTVKGPGGRGIPSDIEITAYEPPTRYAFKVIQGPVRPAGVFRFASSGAG
ncbi:MAG: SRPBCC family protein, partial [Nocardioides sp.]